MKSHGKTFSLLSVCFIAVTTSTAFAQAGATTGKCAFQTLNFPPPANHGGPVALNDVGAILGGFADQNSGHGFLLYQGKLTTFMFPGSANTRASDISRNGNIVGSYDVNNAAGFSETHPFIVQAGGFHEITLPGFSNAQATAAGVNANGDVVGVIFSQTAEPGPGYLLHNGKLTQLSFPGATGGTQPASINDQGVVVGTYFISSQVDRSFGFMWKAGVFSNINPPDGIAFSRTQVTKISNSGVVVGNYVSADERVHGFAFENGTYTKIDVPGFQDAFILGVNKFDNVVAQAQQQTQTGQKIAEVKGFCAAAF
jgi:uncharacterized membrane protein